MPADGAPDPGAFHDFEHAGWEANVSEYEDAFARLTRQSIGRLLEAVDLREGIRLLDIATGPGYVAATAAERGARVVGIDFSAPMVRRARELAPNVDFQEGDAEALSFPDGSFEAVVMNFGILHLARPERAVGEVARVLKPEGRFAFTAWAKPDEALGFGMILNAIQSHGSMDVPLPQGPPFFRFSDEAECDRMLREAGFVAVNFTRIPQFWRFDSPDELFEAVFSGGVRIKAILRAQSRDALEAIRKAVRDAASKLARHGAIEIPMPALLASARKPAG
jgi:SAM-dependent methyltransferase